MRFLALLWFFCLCVLPSWGAASPPLSSKGMVVAQDGLAAKVGAEVLAKGGNAIDAAVATAFALAVTHPPAGNIGGGGFLIYRSGQGEAAAYDFRETAPAAAHPEMFLRDGRHDPELQHRGHRAVGVPGTVAGLWLAWTNHGKLAWSNLVAPAIQLAENGFPLSFELAGSLKRITPAMRRYEGSFAQFTRAGAPYEPGETLKQPDLARTLRRIAAHGPADFYEGETARLIVAEMKRAGGLITAADLRNYSAKKREPVRGSYRGHEIISMPPPSSGGVAIIQALNILEAYDLRGMGRGSADSVHLISESLRRAFADRARHLGDPDFSPALPMAKLISKSHAAELRKTIHSARASVSDPARFDWPHESSETTHLSVVDGAGNAVSLTYTLEESYGSRIVVPGAGFLLNNEIGDFNAAPGMTTTNGLIGTEPNLAAPGKRMLSSMSPTIVTKNGELFLVTGSPGGRTIISTVLLSIIDAIDFGLNAQDAAQAGRFHHQWLPDILNHEPGALSRDTLDALAKRGHTLQPTRSQGVAALIRISGSSLMEGGADLRWADSRVWTVEEAALERSLGSQ